MSAASFDLPRLIDHGRHVRAQVPAATIATGRDRIAGRWYSAVRCRITDDGVIEVQRRDAWGPTWYVLTAALIAEWARDLDLDGDPTDAYAPRLCSSADVAEQVATEVAAMVRAEPSGTPMLPTLAPAAALARRLVGAFELLPDGGVLRWRLRYSDPVRGGPGPLPPPPDDAARVPAGLRPWTRATSQREPGELVTAAEVERAVRAGGYVGAHDPAPSYPDVAAELRLLAGLSPSAPAASASFGPGTSWLRRARS